MVNVNEVLAEFAVDPFKDETANSASIPVMLETISSCARIALISIHSDLFPRPFRVFVSRLQFIRIESLLFRQVPSSLFPILSQTLFRDL